MSYMETYREWCTNPYFSEETRAELEAIKDNEAEIRNKPYEHLHRKTGDTGTCKLYHFPERAGKRSCHRTRFQNHVTGICRGGSTLPECKRNQGLCV